MYPPPTQMLILFIFFIVMSYVPGTHYLTLLCHYQALIYLKIPFYSYCCAFTVLFFLLLGTYILELGLQKKQQ